MVGELALVLAAVLDPGVAQLQAPDVGAGRVHGAEAGVLRVQHAPDRQDLQVGRPDPGHLK